MAINLMGEFLHLKINDGIIKTILPYRQISKSATEAGGMLIGSEIIGTHALIVEDLTTPLSCDKRSRIEYIRNKKHNKLLKKKWIQSKFTQMYLGEWHTHPQNNPSPSSHDIDNWQRLMRDAVTETDNLIFIILGIEVLGIWIGNRKNRKIEKIYEEKLYGSMFGISKICS